MPTTTIHISSDGNAAPADDSGDGQEANAALVQAEGCKLGNVSMAAYLALVSNVGWRVSFLIAAGLLSGEVAYLFSQFCLADWT